VCSACLLSVPCGLPLPPFEHVQQLQPPFYEHHVRCKLDAPSSPLRLLRPSPCLHKRARKPALRVRLHVLQYFVIPPTCVAIPLSPVVHWQCPGRAAARGCEGVQAQEGACSLYPPLLGMSVTCSPERLPQNACGTTPAPRFPSRSFVMFSKLPRQRGVFDLRSLVPFAHFLVLNVHCLRMCVVAVANQRWPVPGAGKEASEEALR